MIQIVGDKEYLRELLVADVTMFLVSTLWTSGCQRPRGIGDFLGIGNYQCRVDFGLREELAESLDATMNDMRIRPLGGTERYCFDSPPRGMEAGRAGRKPHSAHDKYININWLAAFIEGSRLNILSKGRRRFIKVLCTQPLVLGCNWL
jgi:hypothetical protein